MRRNLGIVTAFLYPEAHPTTDYEIRDDAGESGPHIARWDEKKLGPRPTEQQLADAEVPALKARKRREIAMAASRAYRDAFSADGEYLELEKDLILILFLTGRTNQLNAAQRAAAQQAQEAVAKRRQKFSEIAAAETVEEIEAVEW
jgi:hypothetical protein